MNPANKTFQLLLVLFVVSTEGTRTSKCQSCSEREEFRQITKLNLKTEILRKLGLSSPPNITIAGLQSHRFIKNLIHKMETSAGEGMMSDQPGAYLEDDLFQPKLITVLPYRPSSQIVLEHRHWNTLHYKLSEQVDEGAENLLLANLYLHLPPAPSQSHTHARIRIYNVGMDKVSEKVTQFKVKELTWELRTDRGSFVKVDLLFLVRKWIKNSSENIGIVVRAQTNQNQELEVSSLDSHAPYLQLSFGRKESHYRKKRDTNLQCSEEYDSTVTQCCLWPLTIDFSEFGWDWVLFPRTYEANFCSGDCSLGVVPESPHTHLIQMNLHSTAGPCCAARKMSQISMLYLDQDNNVVMGTLPGMKVEKCGCS